MKKVQASIVVFLLVFYMAIFYLVTHPKVSPEYKAYYISRDSNLTIKERKALKPIILGEDISHDDPRVGYDGWHDRETGYRWSAGESSKILFLLKNGDQRDGTLRLSMLLEPLGNQGISVSLNEKRVYDGVLTGIGKIDIPIPATLLMHGENVLRINCPDAHKTGTDKRKRGIALSSFTIQ